MVERSIEAVEKLRLREQLVALQAMISVDTAALALQPSDLGLRFVAQQGRRDMQRLQAALAGRTPSAVFGHSDSAEDGLPAPSWAAQRAALARDEAAHAAHNVLAFADKVAAAEAEADALTAPVSRVVRWALRLHLELADTESTVCPPPRPLALAVLRAAAAQRAAALRQLIEAVAGHRAALRD